MPGPWACVGADGIAILSEASTPDGCFPFAPVCDVTQSPVQITPVTGEPECFNDAAQTPAQACQNNGCSPFKRSDAFTPHAFLGLCTGTVNTFAGNPIGGAQFEAKGCNPGFARILTPFDSPSIFDFTLAGSGTVQRQGTADITVRSGVADFGSFTPRCEDPKACFGQLRSLFLIVNDFGLDRRTQSRD